MIAFKREANELFILRDGSLILTDAVLLEDENGALRLETANAKNILRCYPAGRLEGKAKRLWYRPCHRCRCRGKAQRQHRRAQGGGKAHRLYGAAAPQKRRSIKTGLILNLDLV